MLLRFLFFTALFTVHSVIFMIPGSQAEPLHILQSALPGRINGWSVESEDRFYDPETIFEYINGAGEVYRAYNMRTCLSRRYTAPNGPSIVLDIFLMGASEDAFGVFTHDQDGESLDLGQGALYRPGWLSFWKDRYFVSIYAEEETPASKKALRELGKAVASRIDGRGTKPRILSLLPAEGLHPGKIRYLHHHIVLNYHYFVADKNILNLGPGTHAALATYRIGKEDALLLLVMYTDAEKAKAAHKSFLAHYLPDADSTGVVMLENKKWSAVRLKDKLLAVVLEADSRKLAESLMEEVVKMKH